MYPETARKTLEEIDVLFDANIPPWRSSKVAANALQERARRIERGDESGEGETGLEIEKDKESMEERKEVV